MTTDNTQTTGQTTTSPSAQQVKINEQLATPASGTSGDSSTANAALIKQIIPFIQLSSMQPREKAMWLLLIPAMEESHLLKLKASLEKEVNTMTDIYLNALSKKM